MFYTIGEAAAKLNVAPSTLRYYDREGLLPFVERTNSGIRRFKESDFEWLKLISCLKATGMSLKDIKSFIQLAMQGDSTISERLSLFLERREHVLRQIEALNQTLAVLDFKCWYYETAKSHGTTDILNSMTDADLPERFRDIRHALRGDSLSS